MIRGPGSTISRLLADAGHVRSDCPPHKRLSAPGKHSTGFLVWQRWDGVTLVKQNIHEVDAARMGTAVVEYVRKQLDLYEKTLNNSYHIYREGQALRIGDRK